MNDRSQSYFDSGNAVPRRSRWKRPLPDANPVEADERVSDVLRAP